MYYLFTDETNQQPSEKSEFFIYGGAFVSANILSESHSLVGDVRVRYGFQPGDEFKFSPHTKPAHVEREDFRLAKREVLQGCYQLGVTFSAYLTLHRIAHNKSMDELVSWGANSIIANFDYFLEENGDIGICIVDRLPIGNDFGYLRDRFQHGLQFPDGRKKGLPRILMFAASCEGASHAMSAIDILIGSFRYCVNEREKDIAPREILRVIARMMWYREVGGVRYLRERGLLLRPKNVKVQEFQAAYDDLVKHLQVLSSEKAED